MPHSTEHHTEAQHLEQLLAEAASVTGILPTIDRCQQMQEQLRSHITELADQVRRRLDYLPPGAPEWQRFNQALLQAQGALLGGLGRGLRSAALHVQTLGEAAAVLADRIAED